MSVLPHFKPGKLAGEIGNSYKTKIRIIVIELYKNYLRIITKIRIIILILY